MKPVKPKYVADPIERRRELARLVQEQRWDSLDRIELWDPDDVDALESMLSPDEFQAMLDQLGGDDDR